MSADAPERSIAWRPWLPVAAWIAVIVGFGSEGFAASETHRYITPFLEWLLPGSSPEQRAWLLFFIRKGAHMVEYGVLAWLTARAIARRRPWRPTVLAILALCAFVAMADEARQAQLGRRTGSVRDVAIDLSGAGLALLLRHAVERRREEEEP